MRSFQGSMNVKPVSWALEDVTVPVLCVPCGPIGPEAYDHPLQAFSRDIQIPDLVLNGVD